ncbi:MAG: HU family DNA-binding protein, partial [Phycisphaerales bacterium]|nr:HU family DNA-binding protein [Phycisphaerales bacterium]
MTPAPETITKKELVNRIAEQTDLTKVVVKDVLQKFLDEIID